MAHRRSERVTAMTDFKELAQEFYPGTTRPIIRHPNRNKDEERRTPPPSWDRSPRIYALGGVEREFFTVGNLAEALGRQSVTIRKWEREGVIPKAQFQVPGRNDDPRGRRRLYTRAQVEGIVRIAADEGLHANTRKSFAETQFKERVHALFQQTNPNK